MDGPGSRLPALSTLCPPIPPSLRAARRAAQTLTSAVRVASWLTASVRQAMDETQCLDDYTELIPQFEAPSGEVVGRLKARLDDHITAEFELREGESREFLRRFPKK